MAVLALFGIGISLRSVVFAASVRGECFNRQHSINSPCCPVDAVSCVYHITYIRDIHLLKQLKTQLYICTSVDSRVCTCCRDVLIGVCFFTSHLLCFHARSMLCFMTKHFSNLSHILSCMSKAVIHVIKFTTED